MKTRYLITTTDPDTIDPEGFDDNLDDCQRFTSRQRAKAVREYQSLVNGRTNTKVFLLEIKCIKSGQGRLS